MDVVRIGKSNLKASKVGLGTWSMGGDAQWGNQDDSVSLRAIHSAVEHGINILDTAPAYGFGYSERLIGKALRELPRDQVIIQTKCGFWWKDDEGTVLIERDGKVCRRNLSRRAIMTGVEESLKNLGTDYIDVFITHQQAREPFLVPVEETMDALMELKKQGKIRAIGISNCTEEEIQNYLSCGPVDVLQERFSMLDQEKADRFLPICEKRGITFEAYSPLEQGLLTGKIDQNYEVPKGNLRNKISWYDMDKRLYVIKLLESWKDLLAKYGCNQANLTVAWTLKRAENMLVLGGGRKEQHVLDYIKGGEIDLLEEDKRRMDEDLREMIRLANKQTDSKSREE